MNPTDDSREDGDPDGSGGCTDPDGSDGPLRPELVLPNAVHDEITKRAHDGRPREICGVLGGTFDPDESRVRSQYPAENVADTPRTRYRIDPEEQLEVFERLEDRGEEIVGFYHSHPRGPPRPSETDVATATWPDRSYVIVSLEPPDVGSWRWRSGDEDDGDEDPKLGVDGPSGRFERERIDLESG
ncbi:desampylase [Natrarchaeobius chitinivorans]|uniref:M67 family peptidase n=1 Tax=Natrarchaeobius chitinivorans TaxID=1679083 RepID=A0A3N6M212_NATCH|nr:desampylase [Natrarchaeobius chitinivorans]RQG94394.1 M67 family peptidase [Natrarchaeobius chitinivorans]